MRKMVWMILLLCIFMMGCSTTTSQRIYTQRSADSSNAASIILGTNGKFMLSLNAFSGFSVAGVYYIEGDRLMLYEIHNVISVGGENYLFPESWFAPYSWNDLHREMSGAVGFVAPPRFVAPNDWVQLSPDIAYSHATSIYAFSIQDNLITFIEEESTLSSGWSPFAGENEFLLQ